MSMLCYSNTNIHNIDNTVTIALCGDVMTGRGIDQILAHPAGPQLHEPWVKDARHYVYFAERAHGDIARPVSDDYIWGDALAVSRLENAAACIVNLETAITTSTHARSEKKVHYRMNPRNSACLTSFNIDCCVLANNHVLDWGLIGLRETKAKLSTLDIAQTGAGENSEQAFAPAILALKGLNVKSRILVWSFCLTSSGVPDEWAADAQQAGVNLLANLSNDTLRKIAEAVHAQKRMGDIVVASIHWGENWGYDIFTSQRSFAQRLIDYAGVDLVHGHSSHHPIGMELYRDHLILYGCGDFINDYEGISGHERFRPDLSVYYCVDLNSQNGKLLNLRMHVFKIRQMQLRTADEASVMWLARRLNMENWGLSLGLSKQFVEEI